jgi:hypothetical protein
MAPRTEAERTMKSGVDHPSHSVSGKSNANWSGGSGSNSAPGVSTVIRGHGAVSSAAGSGAAVRPSGLGLTA